MVAANDQGREHATHHHAADNIRVAFWLNTIFALTEIAGGLFTNSVAILSDALHDLGDSLSLGISWYFQRKSLKKGDQVFTYGYQRHSLIGAVLTGMVLTTGSLFILYEAFQRLFNPEPADAVGMLMIALLGLGVNLLAMLRLKKGKTLNEELVSLHFLEDVIGWAAVLVGSVVMVFVEAPLLDPILSILISGYVLFNVFSSLGKVFRILLQGVPSGISEEQIRKNLGRIEGLISLHHIHIWSMDGKLNVMTLHAVIPRDLPPADQRILKQTIRLRLSGLNVRHVTIELEPGTDSEWDQDCRPHDQ